MSTFAMEFVSRTTATYRFTVLYRYIVEISLASYDLYSVNRRWAFDQFTLLPLSLPVIHPTRMGRSTVQDKEPISLYLLYCTIHSDQATGTWKQDLDFIAFI